MSNRSQSARDMLRQEAKLQEMTEEVRRREMRANYSPQQQHYSVSPSRPLVSSSSFSIVLIREIRVRVRVRYNASEKWKRNIASRTVFTRANYVRPCELRLYSQ